MKNSFRFGGWKPTRITHWRAVQVFESVKKRPVLVVLSTTEAAEAEAAAVAAVAAVVAAAVVLLPPCLLPLLAWPPEASARRQIITVTLRVGSGCTTWERMLYRGPAVKGELWWSFMNVKIQHTREK